MRKTSFNTARRDRPALFLGLTFALSIGLLGLVSMSTYFIRWHSAWTQLGALIAFQEAKLKNPAVIDTVFVGDSSLGYGIDAAEFDRAVGTKSLNLAMFGDLAYGASYTMLRRAVDAHPEIRNVVVMHFAQVLLADPRIGFVVTLPVDKATSYMADLGPTERWAVEKTFLAELLGSRQLFLETGRYMLGGPVLVFTDDYVVQGTNLVAPDNTPYPTAIDAGATIYLSAIVDLCRKRGLNCMYAIGPLSEEKLAASEAYLRIATEKIRATGIVLTMEKPVPITRQQLGSSLNHFAPPYKSLSTARYAEILKPYLVPQGQPDGR